MNITCWIRPHKWVFIGNVVMKVEQKRSIVGPGLGIPPSPSVKTEIVSERYGLYQCTRCKELSRGSPDGPHGKKSSCSQDGG